MSAPSDAGTLACKTNVSKQPFFMLHVHWTGCGLALQAGVPASLFYSKRQVACRSTASLGSFMVSYHTLSSVPSASSTVLG